MWVNAAIRYTSFWPRHTAVTAAFSATTARRCLSTNDGSMNSTTAAAAATGISASPDSSSLPFPATAASVLPNKPRESRFKRANVSSQEGIKSFVGGHEANGAIPTSGTDASASNTPQNVEALLARIAYPRDTRSHRALVMYLQQVQSVLRYNRCPSVDAIARLELNVILLPAIKGLDAPAVTLLLQTLWMAGISGTAPIVHDAVAWLSLYGYHLSLPQFVKVVELLHRFNVPHVSDMVRSLPQRLAPRDVMSLTVTQAVVLLTALLPLLRYSTVEETEGKAEKGAGQIRSDVALVEVAEMLRGRCKGTEFVYCDASLASELLQALLAFRSSHEWHSVLQKEAWVSLEEATCLVLTSALQADSIELAQVVQLLTALSDSARGEIQTYCSTGQASYAATDAVERLSSMLAKRLSAAVEAFECASQIISTALSGSPRYAVMELPSPWRPRDVRELWSTCVKSGIAAAMANDQIDSEESTAELAYKKLLEDSQTSLVHFVSRLFAEHQSDVGVSEMAFAVAQGLAQVDRAAVQHVRDSLPVTSESAATSSTAAVAPIRSNLADILPSELLNALLSSSSNQLQEDSVMWTVTTVQDAVTLFSRSSDSAHQTRALELARKWYTQLRARAQDRERVLPQELLAFFTPELLRQERLGVDAAVDASLRRWSVSEVLYFFSRLGASEDFAGGMEGAAVLRQAGSALCAYAAKASAAQLAALVECYGAAQVRNDEFCEAAVKRLAELLDANLTTAARSVNFSTSVRAADAEVNDAATLATSTATASSSYKFASDGAGEEHTNMPSSSLLSSSEPTKSTSPVTLSQLAQILRSFALMEVRQTKPFIDAAPLVTQAANENQGNAEEVTQLLAAYAKMLIWNYPVFRALAERLCRLRSGDVRLDQLLTAQLALLRMDVTLPSVTTRFYEALKHQYSTEKNTQGTRVMPIRKKSAGGPIKSQRAELNDAVMQLSVLSRVRTRSHVTPPDPSVTAEMIEFIVTRAAMLRVEELAEVLLSLARLGQGKSAAFNKLTVRTLGLLPVAPPRVMAHIAEAYALAGRSDNAELFTLIAERTVAMRHDVAAITIASILASFAKAGVRNDRLFIEVIPRVRHVSTYGTPRDVVNVVSAYAAVNLWHYKLFARLADRAIQLRADFRVTELVALLKAYATVQMRYDALFTEFAPRIQTLAHLLTPSDLAEIVSSYSQLSIPCVPVWKATAARAVAVAYAFTENEAERLLDAYSTQGFYEAECVKALTARFPSLSCIPFDVKEEENTESKGEKLSAEK